MADQDKDEKDAVMSVQDLPDELTVEQGIEFLSTGDISEDDESGEPDPGELESGETEPNETEHADAGSSEPGPDGADPGTNSDGDEPAAAQHDDPESNTALVGLGVDIIEIERMESILQRTPHFRERVYTEAERRYCDKKPSPATHYALFFAAKEAVFKALGTGFTGMGINDVEVTHDRFGKPQAILSGNAAKVAKEKGIEAVYLSLSYTHTTGVASAVAARKENAPSKKTQDESEERLALQFKNMRAMLDDIDAKLTQIENAQPYQGDER